MLSRRGFFRAATGAAAVALGGASAAAAPAVSTGVDLAAGADRTAFFYVDDWANDAAAPSEINEASRAAMSARYERMTEIFKDIRGTPLPPWPYPRIEPNDLTREQLAANLPVIGADPLPKNTPAQEQRRKALIRECNRPVPEKETEKQFLKRLSLPCPGRLE